MRKALILGIASALLAGALPAFAATEPDEGAFRRLWERTDAQVASGAIQRTWYWGAEPLRTFDEEYKEGVEGTRRVQYWDKGRMEISNPNDDPNDPWYVTSGLLPIEMISGRIQIGDREQKRAVPADIPVVGDLDIETNGDAPTYRDFYQVTTVFLDSRLQPVLSDPIGPGNADSAAPPRFGDLVSDRLNGNGRVERAPELGAAHPGTRIVYYDGVLSHNIPKVFWDFLQKTGKVQVNGEERQDLLMDWLYMVGHPASEPYWVTTNVDGVPQDIMVQIYERRVLTYNPNNPPAWQVEMGNVGQHYLKWRYEQLETARPTVPTVRPDNINATVDPQQGPPGTAFAVTLVGFRPGEKVSIWLTLPDQSVIPAPEFGEADSSGVAYLFGASPFYVNTTEGLPGVWALTGVGESSGNTAIAYFTVTDQ